MADMWGTVAQNNISGAALNQMAMGNISGPGLTNPLVPGKPYTLPTANPQSGPIFNQSDMNTPGTPLYETLHAGGQGTMTNGVNAFLGESFTPFEQKSGPEGEVSITQDNSQKLFDFAKSIGFDTSNYRQDSPGSVTQLYQALNNKLQNYYSIGGLSQGWRGANDPRHSTTGMYILQDGKFVPTGGRFDYSAPTASSGTREMTGELLSAASVISPAFGGLGGILGAGAEGTLSAGAGLGLTNGLAGMIGAGATNALTGALQSYLLSGGAGGAAGILSSLAGSTLNAGVNEALGTDSHFFDTSNPGALGSVYNPARGMSSMLNNLGLGSMGGAMGLFSGLAGGGINADTIKGIAGELVGSKLGQEIDPRLRHAGATAGRDVVMSLLP